jgi:hypothetical protein
MTWCRYAPSLLGVYAGNRIGRGIRSTQGDALMQSAQPRDVGVLILVISMLLVLFVVSLMLGSPIR